jgi:hypothetical protein
MPYRILADIVVAVHLAYIAYVLLGQLAILGGILLKWNWIRNPWFRFTHLVMIAIVAVESLFAYPCPLTTWENWLVRMDGGSPDQRSFIGRLLHQTVFFQGCEFDHPAFTYAYVGFAILVLATFIFWPPRLKGRSAKAATTPLGTERI